jgi:hypothetical protein
MELARAGAWDDAVVHFLHPKEEIYDELRPELRRRRAQGFAATLDTLAARVRAKRGGPGLESDYRQVLAAVDRAWTAGLPVRVRTSPAFVAEVAARAMRSAAAEYEAAIEESRFANVVEYQDGRGFLLETDALLNRNAAALRAAPGGAAAWNEAQSAMAALRPVWPTPRPPEAPVLGVTEVIAAVSRFERAAVAWR